jgi:S1-C subfamily serine protease
MATTFSHDAVADIVERIGSSIVRIDAGHRFSGTGTAWSEDLVVTANHVVERDEDIEIGLDGEKTAKATVVGRDETSNTALLKVDGAKLVPAKFRSLTSYASVTAIAIARPGKTVRELRHRELLAASSRRAPARASIAGSRPTPTSRRVGPAACSSISTAPPSA